MLSCFAIVARASRLAIPTSRTHQGAKWNARRGTPGCRASSGRPAQNARRVCRALPGVFVFAGRRAGVRTFAGRVFVPARWLLIGDWIWAISRCVWAAQATQEPVLFISGWGAAANRILWAPGLAGHHLVPSVCHMPAPPQPATRSPPLSAAAPGRGGGLHQRLDKPRLPQSRRWSCAILRA